jgi:hypothetical protein
MVPAIAHEDAILDARLLGINHINGAQTPRSIALAISRTAP